MSAAAPGILDVLTSWPVEPLAWIALAGAAVAYHRAFTKIEVRPFPRRRRVWFMAGLGAVAVAVASPLHSYAGELLWVHMVQHLVLTMVAAPLLVLGAPSQLAFRASPSRWRRRMVALRRRLPTDLLMHPVVAWATFAVGMWVLHFSDIYDAALDNSVLHALEHVLFLALGLMFWAPVCTPRPRRAPALWPPVRVAYLLAALPLQSWLGLAVYSAGSVLYPHYETVARTWGPTPLEDQRIAGIVMWVGGDALFLVALGLAIGAWMRAEEQDEDGANRPIAQSSD